MAEKDVIRSWSWGKAELFILPDKENADGRLILTNGQVSKVEYKRGDRVPDQLLLLHH